MAKRKTAPTRTSGAKVAETAASAAATRAVVQIGRHGGRGFILAVSDKRYVVTAAHCFFDKLPFPHLARSSHDVTYRNMIGPLGGKRRVSAECVFVDPIADIAVFGTPDNQDRGEEALAYEELTDGAAFRIGRMPKPVRRRHPSKVVSLGGEAVEIAARTFLEPAVSEASMLSLDGEWFTCQLACPRDALWFDQAAQPVIGGMSGSPIVLPDGSAVGVVCTSDGGHGDGRAGGPNPMLAAHLPGWLLEQR